MLLQRHGAVCRRMILGLGLAVSLALYSAAPGPVAARSFDAQMAALGQHPHRVYSSQDNRPLRAEAATYYVATDGSDSNPGTESHPFLTAQKAADMASVPGDTVIFRGGTYDGFHFRFSGSSSAYITFKSYTGEKPVFLGNDGGYGIWTNDIDWIVLDGLTFRDASKSNIQLDNISHWIIRNCDFFGAHGNNIYFGGAQFVTIDANRLFDNGYLGTDRYHGHQIYGTGRDVTITNNLMYNGSCYGVQLAAYDQTVLSHIKPGYEGVYRWNISNNVMVHQKGCGGIVVWDGVSGNTDDVNIQNNTFYDNAYLAGSTCGVRFLKEVTTSTMTNIRIHDNVYYCTRAPFITLAGDSSAIEYTETDNTNADPGFVALSVADSAANDFHLQAGSPAIDHGVSISAPDHDFDYNVRPLGAGYDIGAFEYAEPSNVFVDVPTTYPYHDEIEALYLAGYTAGCNTNPLRYCPDQTMNRAESAVFVERGIHGTDGLPSQPTTQTFADLPLDSWAAKWAEALWADGYTAGCGTNPLVYCPWQGHTRAEGCVFYLSMLNGADYQPPQPTQQIFADVALDTWYAKWVQAAYEADLLEPCQTSPDIRFCPGDSLTRAMAAHMMVKAKNLPLP